MALVDYSNMKDGEQKKTYTQVRNLVLLTVVKMG